MNVDPGRALATPFGRASAARSTASGINSTAANVMSLTRKPESPLPPSGKMDALICVTGWDVSRKIGSR